jgi:hypothetical protein
VNPEPDTLSTVPTDPPAADPDRALDPPPGTCCPAVAETEAAAVAVPEPLFEVTMPAAPPPITTAAIPAASNLVAFRERRSLRVNIWKAPSVDAIQLSFALDARINV